MKKLIEQLVEASYTDNQPDLAAIMKIADKLQKKDLALYIKALKNHAAHTTIRFESAYPMSDNHVSALKQIFGNKTVLYTQNKDLILGIRVTDNDTVYNMNLKNTLERITSYATE